MQTTSFFHHLPLAGAPFSGNPRHPKTPFLYHRNLPATLAFKKDGSGGKMVDEDMITLRERIRKMECDNDDHRLPDNWMQWEKTYISSGCYHSDVYEVVAFLQRFLMESRPSVVLGLLLVFLVGGSTAAVAVLQCLMNLIRGD